MTGYTLYDAVAYVQEIGWLTNFSYNTGSITDEIQRNNVLNYLHKIRIKEKLDNGNKIIRPLLIFREDTIAEYLVRNRIPYVDVPCKISNNKEKRLTFKVLNEMKTRMRITYEGLLDFLEKQNVSFPENFNDISGPFNFTDC